MIAAWVVVSSAVASSTADTKSWSPEWTKDLVVYEIATKAFTSPNGPGSGTFKSLEAKLAYLQELGINGIWLSGHSLADPKHFYNIWTQYAVIEPDKIDPSLGTPREFKAMIDAAHRRGIKVFLDVITHGVMPGSDLVKRHPKWFRGGSWGMVDYDWEGDHKDLDDWWVKIWTDCVIQYGVDGFRLDVDIYRPDLWKKIRRNASEAGHSIVIFAENESAIPGVTDFAQRENRLHAQASGELSAVLTNDIPQFYRQKFGSESDYKVRIRYDDGSEAEGTTSVGGALEVRVQGLTQDKVSRQWRNLVSADGIVDLQLMVSGVADLPVRELIVTRSSGQTSPDLISAWWSMLTEDRLWAPHGRLSPIVVEGRPPVLTLYAATLGYGSSVQLSSHDNGWTGFPADKNPYTAQGSRSLFGYSVLFTPMIPIFMSGEEFDAGFHALPGLSPDLFGGKNPGAGRWLYGSMLDWNELEQPQHRAMFQDVKALLAIRKQEELGAQVRGDIEPNLVAVSHTSDIQVPVPYMRWNGNSAVVVVANRNTAQDAHLKLRIALEQIGGSNASRYRVTDLWNGGKPATQSAKSLADFSYTVRRDKSPKGGVGILKIERIQ